MHKQVIDKAQKSFPAGGTILEFGVFSGGSYIQLAQRILQGWPCKLIGFDSWQGLPKETEDVWCRYSPGDFASSKSVVENRLLKLGIKLPDERFELIDGWFKNTLTKERQLDIKNVILVNVDVDIHKSAKLALDFIAPLLQEGTIIYFDDWKQPRKGCGEELAFLQWILANPKIKYELTPLGGQMMTRIRI